MPKKKTATMEEWKEIGAQGKKVRRELFTFMRLMRGADLQRKPRQVA